VKICGITTPEDALLAVELGADLLGLNFWPRSPRAVSLVQAAEVAAAVRGRVLLVGVFVDERPAAIASAVAAARLDLVQLHGDEEPEVLRDLARAGVTAGRVVRALRVGPSFEGASAVAPWDECWGFLFDASRPGMYGGTGETWPWRRVADAAPERRVLVAGGVAPGRLRPLLASAGDWRPGPPGSAWRPGSPGSAWRPWGIDVCSGVESTPGRKDPAKLRALFEEVRSVETPSLA
jgi:phosphoribosylanthranilate isomerase